MRHTFTETSWLRTLPDGWLAITVGSLVERHSSVLIYLAWCSPASRGKKKNKHNHLTRIWNMIFKIGVKEKHTNTPFATFLHISFQLVRSQLGWQFRSIRAQSHASQRTLRYALKLSQNPRPGRRRHMGQE